MVALSISEYFFLLEWDSRNLKLRYRIVVTVNKCSFYYRISDDLAIRSNLFAHLSHRITCGLGRSVAIGIAHETALLF